MAAAEKLAPASLGWATSLEFEMRSDTIVIQTFREHSVPIWIQRCLDSVQRWARLQGYEYALAGDEFYDLCGPDYLARGRKNPQAITNLARLVAARQRLEEGYRRVIWLDADVFVFDPDRLIFDFPAEGLSTGYGFGRQVWFSVDPAGMLRATLPSPHNALALFTQDAVDLDMLITLIRHIDTNRQIVTNGQVGVTLLLGLQNSLMFPTFSHGGMFSPSLLHAIADGNEKALRAYGKAYRYEACAANLCLATPGSEDEMKRVMDRLERGAGEAINKHATETGVHLVAWNQPASPPPFVKRTKNFISRQIRAAIRGRKF